MPTIWRVAPALDTLLGQLNALAPRRSRVSDGSIGDQAHASRSSDHNPRIIAGQNLVSARDFTHDLAGGLDCNILADALKSARDSRVKYVIWNKHIMSGSGGPSPWTWRAYKGTNPHTRHLHLSVVGDARALEARAWKLPGFAARTWESLPTLREGDSGESVKALQRWFNVHDWTPDLPLLVVDGDYGPATVRVVRSAQAQCGVTGSDADGTIIGPRTKRAFWERGFRG
jgi:hypothetical protein